MTTRRVAHCVHGLGLGGAQQVIRMIASGGPSRGIEHVVYSPEAGVLAGAIAATGASIRILPRRFPKVDPGWARALGRAMRDDRIDVVHTHLFGDSLHGYLGARRAGGIPVVMTLHNTASAHTRLQQLGYRWLLSRVAKSVACTETARRSFTRMLPPGARPILTIPNGIPIGPPPAPAARSAARDRLGLPLDVAVVGASGRLVEEKGFTYLLTSIAGLAAVGGRPVWLVLVGEGPLRSHLETQARRQGTADRVRFTGFREDAPALLPAFDAVAFPSLFDGLPIALLEAMAAARCIVASEGTGMNDAIADRREALLVPPRDPDALRAALTRVLEDPSLATALATQARSRCEDEFTATRMIARYHAVYAEVAGAP